MNVTVKSRETLGQSRLAYSVDEVAAMLGVSVALIRLEIRRGRLRTFRVGARIMIPVDELARLAKSAR